MSYPKEKQRYFQWQFLRRNPDYRANFEFLVSEGAPKVMRALFSMRWRISRPVDYRQENLPPKVQFSKSFTPLGPFSQGELLENKAPSGKRISRLISNSFDAIIEDSNSAMDEKRFLCVVIDLNTFQLDDKDFRTTIRTQLEQARKRLPTNKRTKVRTDENDLFRLLRIYDQRHFENKSYDRIAKELSTEPNQGHITKDNIRSLLRNAERYVKTAPYLPIY